MLQKFSMLFEHERSALLEALRRDMRAELRRAEADTKYADFHLANYRSSLRLLETLNPERME